MIYDGDETVYAVPFLSMEEQYQNGKDFLGGLTLTQARKTVSLRLKKERRVKNEAVFARPFYIKQHTERRFYLWILSRQQKI